MAGRRRFASKKPGQLNSDRAVADAMNVLSEFPQAFRAVKKYNDELVFPEQEKTSRMTEEAIRALDEFIDKHLEPLLNRPGAVPQGGHAEASEGVRGWRGPWFRTDGERQANAEAQQVLGRVLDVQRLRMRRLQRQRLDDGRDVSPIQGPRP